MLDAARADRTWGWLPLRVLKQGEGDAAFSGGLVEDQTKAMMSYAEFLLHCHRDIISKVT